SRRRARRRALDTAAITTAATTTTATAITIHTQLSTTQTPPDTRTETGVSGAPAQHAEQGNEADDGQSDDDDRDEHGVLPRVPVAEVFPAFLRLRHQLTRAPSRGDRGHGRRRPRAAAAGRTPRSRRAQPPPASWPPGRAERPPRGPW